MGMLLNSPHCAPCEKRTHWIELLIKDEHNQAFHSVPGVLIDGDGIRHAIVVDEKPIVLTSLSAGPIQLELDYDSWVEQAQQRLPFVESSQEVHTVIKGDSLSWIAVKNNMMLDDLLNLNPQYQSNPNALQEGDEVKLTESAQQNPIQTWLKQNPTGYNAAARQLITLTTGDLLANGQDLELPQAHHKNQADVGQWTPDNSYLIKIKGFNYKTLRLGVFFDGTGNNTNNHMQGKAELREWLTQTCANPAEVESELEKCLSGQLPVQDSYANDVTNIGKLSEMYLSQDSLPNVHPVSSYIQGIATYSGEEDSELDGAVSVSHSSIKSRVDEACQTIIVDNAVDIIQFLSKCEGYNKIEIDVFGFSRGAAAARHFANLIDQKPDHLLAQAFANNQDLTLKTGFDWAKRSDCRITFIGLFDTVESSWQNTLLGLEPDVAERVVQIVANDEIRGNFPLTRITDDIAGTQIAPNFTEVIMPGVHSDIGGGYYSRYSLPNVDATPILTEQIILRAFVSNEYGNYSNVNSQAYNQALDYAKQELQAGWGTRIVDISQAGYLQIGDIGLHHQIRYVGGNNLSQNNYVKVYLKRVVEGELSRVALRIMVEAARAENVPLDYWDIEDGRLKTQSNNSAITIDLSRLEKEWAFSATVKGQVVNLAEQLDPQSYKALRYHYIHHSDNQNDWINKIVYYANNTYFDSSAQASREIFPNTPGKTS